MFNIEYVKENLKNYTFLLLIVLIINNNIGATFQAYVLPYYSITSRVIGYFFHFKLSETWTGVESVKCHEIIKMCFPGKDFKRKKKSPISTSLTSPEGYYKNWRQEEKK